MKPLKLIINGINSFSVAQTVDFERLSSGGMFCISGPTGSGKTTILDSVILALYAPREHNRGNMKDYINTKCDRGSVTLDFESDGVRYRVWREFRKNASSAAKLTNLDTSEVLADRAETVTDKIKEMLRLDKEDFTKVVILEQGKFSKFMLDEPRYRFDTVANLFGLKRFEQLKDTVSKAKNKYDKLLSENKAALEQYDGVTEEKYNLAKKQMRELKKELAKLTEEEAKVGVRLKELERVRDAFERAKSASETVKECDAKLKEAEDERKQIAELEKEVGLRNEKLKEMKTASDSAHAMRSLVEECKADMENKDNLKKERDELRDKYKTAQASVARIKGETEALNGEKERNEAKCASIMRDVAVLGYEAAELTEAGFAAVRSTAQADYARLSDAERKKEAAQDKIAECEALADKLLEGKIKLDEQIRNAEKALEKAKSEYEHARVDQAAAAVRAGIADGDACPVCGGVYHAGAVLTTVSDGELAALKAACDVAENTLAAQKAQSDRNKITQSENDGRHRTARETLAECDAIIGGRKSADAQKAAKLAGEGAAAAKVLNSDEKRISELNSLAAAAKAEADRIESDGKRVAGDIAALEKRIAERLKGQSVTDAEKSANEAIRAYDEAQKETEEANKKLSETKAALAVAEAEARSKREEAQKTVLALGDTKFDARAYEELKNRAAEIAEEIRSKSAEYGGTEREAEEVRSRLERKKKLTEDRRAYEKKAGLITKLYKCVESNKLFSFVAESKIQSFTDNASETLSSLTQGKFTLSYKDKDFYVADFFAGNIPRKVRTLSGGETFLTSMSLAMAISQEIASQNYEFFFLDEGFGTLHEQALDTVTAALRELSKSTTVGVVTHRSEIAAVVAAQLKVSPANEDVGSRVEILGV